MRFLRLSGWLGLIALSLVAAGCGSGSSKKKNYPVTVARFMMEASDREVGSLIRLPISGSTISVLPKTYFTEYDITKCEVVDNELGKCLYFQFTEQAARDLYRLTATNQGRRLITTVNGAAVGAVRFDRPISQGFVITYVETPVGELEAMAKNINLTSADARKEAEKKR
ncbi:MAG: hypothetical protein NTU80_11110 [Verrucomicrobia bacterium]|nr:hypothetical protein [Verrucomicrobiota bacterium]